MYVDSIYQLVAEVKAEALEVSGDKEFTEYKEK